MAKHSQFPQWQVAQQELVINILSATISKRWTIRRVIRIGFILWALIAMLWLANSVRTQGVDKSTLQSNSLISVQNNATSLAFLPSSPNSHAGLIFICGSGVAAEAYAPLLRPIAEDGTPVFIVKLPYRFAPRDTDKNAAIGRVDKVMVSHPEVKYWVVAGHSLGGALTAKLAMETPELLSAIILIATTHPKDYDLSRLDIPVIKIYASNDGIAPLERVLANKDRLPSHTRWLELKGGNHSQFGRYGHQLLDGTATISREEQEAFTRSAIRRVLADIKKG
ncbi:alpha/beta hydrolase [Neptunicella sp. SCSIO 80796]|uniref:alpha/beta hydrolase n=1 Tax=Neptunicella plasticusilytica TaxID=3117012 RepID=UPI003A4DA2E5